jgi:transcriptional regulator with XRE-family HTH domain
MPGPFEGRLSRYIRHRREELRLTHQQLADLIQVSPGFVSLVESGHRRLDLDRIPQLADALETDRTYLCWMAVIEGKPVIFQELFGAPVLADLADAIAAKGGQS